MAISTTGHGNEAAHGTADAWQATRSQTVVATQFAENEQDYLSGPQGAQIGRHVGGDQHEMFVSCDPAEALQQQLEHLRPDYIALHDLGTTSTRKLLASVAAASQRTLQKLVIRRQGYGTPLVTLEFLDLPTGDGQSLRLYTTETDAETDPVLGESLAKVLLGYSRLGVLMVGDLPAMSIKASLDALHDVMVGRAWLNRHLLLLPLTTSPHLAQEAVSLGRGTGVQVRTTPQVTRPADAWSFVSGTWNKLRAQAAGVPVSVASSPTPFDGIPSRPQPLAPSPSPVTQPAPMTPMPSVRSAPSGVESTLGRYVRMLGELTGMVSCCVFDIANGRALVHAGARPGADDLAVHGAAMLASLGTASRTLGLGHALPEAAITLGAHHLLLRGVPKHPGVALHAVLDKTHANLTLARLQIVRMDVLFDEPTS